MPRSLLRTRADGWSADLAIMSGVFSSQPRVARFAFYFRIEVLAMRPIHTRRRRRAPREWAVATSLKTLAFGWRGCFWQRYRDRTCMLWQPETSFRIPALDLCGRSGIADLVLSESYARSGSVVQAPGARPSPRELP